MKWIWAILGLTTLALVVWRAEKSGMIPYGEDRPLAVIAGQEPEKTPDAPLPANLETTTVVRMPPDVVALLNRAETLELLSLDPNVEEPDPKTAFHGYEVLGRMHLADATSRSLIVDEVVRGTEITYTIQPDGSVMMSQNLCGMSPRHGIRVTSEAETLDLVICHECGDIDIHRNDEEVERIGTTTTPPEYMNQILREAGIKLDDSHA